MAERLLLRGKHRFGGSCLLYQCPGSPPGLFSSCYTPFFVLFALATMAGWYSRWIDNWETRLANRDQNRVERPFDWGLDWIGLAAANGAAGQLLASFSTEAISASDQFFAVRHRPVFELWRHGRGQTLRFPSAVVTPFPENNIVHAEFVPASGHEGRAVLVIPQWNSDEASHLALCRVLQRIGISALRLSKAYHHQRKPAHLQRADYHVSSNLGRTIHATRQSVLDAICCLDWLQQQGYHRIGILGTSLGSCVALLAAAHDPRPSVAVFNHVSLYFSDVVWTGMSCRHIRRTLENHISPRDLRDYWKVISPASYLPRLATRPLNNLLIWGAYDTTFLPEHSRDAIDAFRALGIPHQVRRLPCGHYTSGKFPFSWMDAWTMCTFLHRHL
jgi:hypothetical protein